VFGKPEAGSDPVPGRELHPLKSSAFHRALLRPLSTPELVAAVFGSMARQTLMNPEDRNTSEKEKGQHSRWPKTPPF
jgi:hypothetical protein